MRTWATVMMLALVALVGCTSDDGGGSDSDRDGLTDGDERNGWRITVQTSNASFDKDVNSDPFVRDTDGDGVDDLFEFALGLDPRNPDTDEDGLTDCQEVFHTVLEDCEDPDFDGEGDGGYGTSGSLYDSDAAPSRYVNIRPDQFSHRLRDADGQIERGDGLSDGDEVAGFTIELPGNRSRHVTTDPLRVDTDQDFLEDAEEVLIHGTDPTVFDTDGDGCEDGFDPFPFREERYAVGLESITWDAPGRSGDTNVLFLMSIVDRGVRVPDGGNVAIQHGQTEDLTGLDEGTVRYLDCSYPIDDPWVRIDIQIVEIDHGPLDVQSETVPNGVSVWWQPVQDRFRWDFRQGPDVPRSEATSWSGTEGAIEFSPRVEFP